MLHFARIRRALPYVIVPMVLLAVFCTPTAFAQSGYYVVPTATLEGIYDDNIFFDAEDEIDDFITRLIAEVEAGYNADTLTWLISFRNDAEWYQDLSDLDSSTARQFGVASIEYEPNRRWTLDGSAEYTKSNSVQDLSLTPGGEIPGRVGRADAERRLLSGGARYQIRPELSGAIDVFWVEDDIEETVRNETLSAAALFEQNLSPARTLLYGYDYRDYEFENEFSIDPAIVITDSEDSHTFWLGLREEFSERSAMEVRAGPRFSDGDVDPYFFLNWRRAYDRGSTLLEARWDETSIIGERGRVQTQSILASWNHKFSEDFETRASASYARLSRDREFLSDDEADLAAFELAGIYRFNRYIFATARYAFNTQDTDLGAGISEKVDHNVASLSVTFTWPRRDDDRSTI